MAEQRAVESTLQIFICSRVPTLYFHLDVVGFKSTNAFLTLNKSTLKTVHKKLSGAVEEVIAAARRVYCGLMTN